MCLEWCFRLYERVAEPGILRSVLPDILNRRVWHGRPTLALVFPGASISLTESILESGEWYRFFDR